MLEQYLELTQLDRLVDRADYAVIGPTDARTRVVSATRAPYWAVCQVQRDFGDGKFSGCSGFLIAPNIVLTAGHCVFSAARALLKKRATPSRIQIIAGRNGTATPFGVRWAKRWYFPSAFSVRRDRESDYGIIVLDQPLANAHQFISPFAPTDLQLRSIRSSRLLHIAGYPGDKPRGTMWEHAERLDRFTRRSIFYSVDTCPGHSGSPVWTVPQRNSAARVIGIHVAGPTPHTKGAWGCRPGVPVAPAGNFNRGIRMNATILAQIQNVKSHTRDPSLVEVKAKPGRK